MMPRLAFTRESMESFDRIKQLLASAEEDLAKAKGGNKAAGVRVRGIMQEVKDAAQEVRQQILALRGQAEPGTEKKA
jgi:hypothetical protein